MAAAAVRPWGWPVKTAAAIALLNLFDCLFTLVLLHLGICREANPLMRALYAASPWLFALVKLAVVNLALAVLLRASGCRLARAGLALGAAVYLALAAYELHQLVRLVSA